MPRDAVAVWMDKTGHTLPEKPAKRFPFGRMCLWCVLSLVMAFVFYYAKPVYSFWSSTSGIPLSVGIPYSINLILHDPIEWQSWLWPLFCLLATQLAAFATGKWLSLKSPVIQIILVFAGVVLGTGTIKVIRGLASYRLFSTYQIIAKDWQYGTWITYILLPLLLIFAGMISLYFYAWADHYRRNATGEMGRWLKMALCGLLGSDLPSFAMISTLCY